MSPNARIYFLCGRETSVTHSRLSTRTPTRGECARAAVVLAVSSYKDISRHRARQRTVPLAVGKGETGRNTRCFFQSIPTVPGATEHLRQPPSCYTDGDFKGKATTIREIVSPLLEKALSPLHSVKSVGCLLPSRIRRLSKEFLSLLHRPRPGNLVQAGRHACNTSLCV